MATVSYEEGGDSRSHTYSSQQSNSLINNSEKYPSLFLSALSLLPLHSRQTIKLLYLFFNSHDSQFNPCSVNLTREFLLWRSRLTFAPSWQRRAATGVVNLNLEFLALFTNTNGAPTDTKATILTSINVSAAQRRGLLTLRTRVFFLADSSAPST